MMRRVDALLAEFGRGLAQPLLRVADVFRQIARERGLGGCPAIVFDAFADPLLAVEALAAAHYFFGTIFSSRPCGMSVTM